jgi:hypothetical protein
MQVHLGPYTVKLDLEFAASLIGISVGIDLCTMYVYSSTIIVAYFRIDRMPAKGTDRYFSE